MRKAIVLIIRIYQWIFSPLLGFNCRFTPTCSAYCIEAVDKYGVLKGGYFSVKRLARCHPWCDGGYDPVP